ncbi:transglutaminase-like protein [Leptospira ryugenii]|uniref:Transglutaminase-like protein n=1 Tax=Leptospira ryugenii TaxID=1917863 RepID=A0A2P2E1K4_9LEPT|nr:transglutaminase-like protein [Leptospira ryugenii]
MYAVEFTFEAVADPYSLSWEEEPPKGTNFFASRLRTTTHFYALSPQKNQSVITLKSLRNGETQSITWNGKLFAWSFYGESVWLLESNTLTAVDPISFAIKQSLPFPISIKKWSDIVIEKDRLYLLSDAKVLALSLPNFQQIAEYEIPQGKAQRMLRGPNGNLYIISTFWGAILRELDPKTMEWKKSISAKTHHHDLMKATDIADGLLPIFDLENKKSFSLYLFGDQFLKVSNGLSLSKSKEMLRISPKKTKLSAVLNIKAKQNVSAQTIRILLPPKQTYSQEIIEESLLYPGKIEEDEDGNRVLFITMPALTKDQVWEKEIWTADLYRYQVRFKPSYSFPISEISFPSHLNEYIKDHPTYDLNHEQVLAKKIELFDNDFVIYLKNVYAYAVGMPYAKGKFDPAPLVIQKYKGGCTEHSYVQIALLRAAGIPARLVWNFLPWNGATEFELNHKFVEVWFPNYGWIPLEPLAPPRKNPGDTDARHLVWARLATPYHPLIHGGDRLVSPESAKAQKQMQTNVRFRLVEAENEEGEPISNFRNGVKEDSEDRRVE